MTKCDTQCPLSSSMSTLHSQKGDKMSLLYGRLRQKAEDKQMTLVIATNM